MSRARSFFHSCSDVVRTDVYVSVMSAMRRLKSMMKVAARKRKVTQKASWETSKTEMSSNWPRAMSRSESMASSWLWNASNGNSLSSSSGASMSKRLKIDLREVAKPKRKTSSSTRKTRTLKTMPSMVRTSGPKCGSIPNTLSILSQMKMAASPRNSPDNVLSGMNSSPACSASFAEDTRRKTQPESSEYIEMSIMFQGSQRNLLSPSLASWPTSKRMPPIRFRIRYQEAGPRLKG
mmetsp:Transcript_49244/g.116908  ORF Transcript_49244/g.116908 Transcript_49244/m.116908 type:complete len:236 (-) Transcript_49244:1234-1941(-)